MSLDIFWFLPTSGDTRYLGKSESGRPPISTCGRSPWRRKTSATTAC